MNYSIVNSWTRILFLKFTFFVAKQRLKTMVRGTTNTNINDNNLFTYLSLIWIAFFSSTVLTRLTIVFTTDMFSTSVVANYADFFIKNVIISMGSGKTIVEFFSAEIVFKVLGIENKQLILLVDNNKVAFMNLPADIEVEVPLASRQLFQMPLVKHVMLFVHLRMQ